MKSVEVLERTLTENGRSPRAHSFSEYLVASFSVDGVTGNKYDRFSE